MRPAQFPGRSKGRHAALLFVIALILVGAGSRVGMAQTTGKVITLGESLSPAQRDEMLKHFKAKDEDKIYTITEKDTDDAMKGIIEDVGQGVSGAYSSTALTCRDLGDGLSVSTRNINLITPSMYAMALVTAGIGDARLLVSGPFDSTAAGTTAMAGVFITWDLAPCESGNTSKARQRLALEQLALTSDIGREISTPGTNDGVQKAADVILETQKTIVTDKLTRKSDIDEALRDQERDKGIVIPADLREKLVDLFLRLAQADIDWSTFSAGWTIDIKENTLTMKGEGIAIRHARETATAEAAAALTATAEAAAALTATAEANMTATAEANISATAEANAALTATAAAQATQDAIAALTATAAAQPTATPMPTPTATPSPFGVTGKVTSVDGDQLSVKAAGSNEAAQYTVDNDASITRGGEPAKLDAVKKGDTVSLTIDGNTNHVRVISATAAPAGFAGKITGLWWLIPVAAVVPIFFLWKGRGVGDPFVVKRVAAA